MTHRIQDEDRNKLDDAVESHVLENREVCSKCTSALTNNVRHTLDVVGMGGEGSSHTGFSFRQGDAYMSCFQCLDKTLLYC